MNLRMQLYRRKEDTDHQQEEGTSFKFSRRSEAIEHFMMIHEYIRDVLDRRGDHLRYLNAKHDAHQSVSQSNK